MSKNLFRLIKNSKVKTSMDSAGNRSSINLHPEQGQRPPAQIWCWDKMHKGWDLKGYLLLIEEIVSVSAFAKGPIDKAN